MYDNKEHSDLNSMDGDDLPEGLYRVCGKYRLQKKIGSGSFGDVFSAKNIFTGEHVAVKIENLDCDHPKLEHEWGIYQTLAIEPAVGIPHIYWYGCEEEFDIIVMSLLGPSLEELFNVCNRKFSIKTVLMLADQMISRLEYIHNRHVIHRDIKPENFLLGRNPNLHQIHIIDFGLAKRFCDGRTSVHIPCSKHKSLIGTARYASINAHLGVEQSRRDDLESVAYLLIYFLRGALPWQHLERKSRKPGHHHIMKQKRDISSIDLCSGLPEEFCLFLDYARTLPFTSKPDYDFLRVRFRDLFSRHGYQNDGIFDWDMRRNF